MDFGSDAMVPVCARITGNSDVTRSGKGCRQGGPNRERDRDSAYGAEASLSERYAGVLAEREGFYYRRF